MKVDKEKKTVKLSLRGAEVCVVGLIACMRTHVTVSILNLYYMILNPKP